jgi:hypothetical protein
MNSFCECILRNFENEKLLEFEEDIKKTIKNAQFQIVIQKGQETGNDLILFITKIVLGLQDIWRIKNVVIVLLENYLEVEQSVLDKFKKDCEEEENNSKNDKIIFQGRGNTLMQKPGKRQRPKMLNEEEKESLKKIKFDNNLRGKNLGFTGVTNIINNTININNNIGQEIQTVAFNNIASNIPNNIAKLQSVAPITESPNVSNIRETSNTLAMIASSMSLHAENRTENSNTLHSTDYKIAANISNQKSTNATNFTTEDLSNKKNQESNNKLKRGINSMLQGSLVNRPTTHREKSLNKSRKKIEGNLKMMQFFDKMSNEIKDNISFVNTSNQNSNIKGAIRNQFYKNNKTYEFDNREENNSNLSNSSIIYPEQTKFSKRAKSQQVNIAGKYDNILFNRNNVGRIKPASKNEKSSVHSCLTDDEILCENTPTKLDQFKFMKKSPSKNEIIKNYDRLFKQK